MYLEAFHLGRALGENYPGQQEEEGVDYQAIDRFPIQEQTGVDGLNQSLGFLVKRIRDIYKEK